ncbi:MAG TPA: NAD(P)H-dependent glycerol-3-phosphate dehydrogenase [Patescibacteria group bacterium]|nr:NAD(P)H-dependent glycerol-3-phosphate dehydrogenase [Patescibacteria group bacterium]
MSSIAILGAGAMGSAIAKQLERHKRPIRLFDIDQNVIQAINEKHENTVYLPGIKFASHVTATTELKTAIEKAEVIFVVLPSHCVAQTINEIALSLSPKTILVNISKGLDEKTFLPPILSARLPAIIKKRICVVGGPAIAQDLSSQSPTGFIVASQDLRSQTIVKKLLQSENVKVALSKDVKGVGLAAALKNAYAISLGMCDGLKFPTNAKALILTVALQEMSLVLTKLGAKQETAYGLAGVGDLVVTGFSSHGRNRSYGERLVGAKTKDPKELGLTTVEGISATKLAIKMVKATRVQAPLLASIHACLDANKDFVCPFEGFVKKLILR